MHSSLQDKRCQECLSMTFLKCWQRDPQGMKRFGSFKAVSLKGLSQDSNIKHLHSFICFTHHQWCAFNFKASDETEKQSRFVAWMSRSLSTAYWMTAQGFLKNKRKPLISVSYNNKIIGPNQSHAEPLIAAENILELMSVMSRKASHC